VGIDVTRLLDRQYEHLVNQGGRDFFLRLQAYVSYLLEDAALRSVLEELEHETWQAREEFVAKENQILEEAILVREELVAHAPEVDDAGMEEPDPASHEYWRYDFSLAKFDRVAGRNIEIGFPKIPDDSLDPSPVSELLNILRRKVRIPQFGDGEDLDRARENRRPDLDDTAVGLSSLAERHGHALRAFRQASRTLPGLALGRLEIFASQLNPEPEVVALGADRVAERFDRALRQWWTPEWIVQKAVNGMPLGDSERRRFDEIETVLKAQAALLHEELVRRVATRERQEGLRFRAKVRRVLAHVYEKYLVQIIGALVIAGVFYLIGHFS